MDTNFLYVVIVVQTCIISSLFTFGVCFYFLYYNCLKHENAVLQNEIEHQKYAISIYKKRIETSNEQLFCRTMSDDEILNFIKSWK